MTLPRPPPGPPGSRTLPRWARAALDRLAGPAEGVPEPGSGPYDRLCSVLSASPAVASWVVRDPGVLASVLDPDLGREQTPAGCARAFGGEPGGDVLAFFRRVRNRELARIVAREVLGLAPVPVTAREVSAVAEAAVSAAVARACRELDERFGPCLAAGGGVNPVCVLGMGKLAGRELNLASDVDLLFLYGAADGETAGGPDGRVPAPDYFARLVRRVAELLGRVTADGFVFRVDLDLRPEGRSGPVAQPVDNAVLYYQSWGQTWERAVLMRARPVAGDLELGRRFLEELGPFVYRRSLDYTTVEDIKEMKLRIDAAAARRLGGGDDLKLGRGGIREVEFFVQTLQLVHGGRFPGVRTPNTLDALDRLAAEGVVGAGIARRLGRCYRFLRRVEHAVQALHFRQTHRLPAEPEEVAAVARAVGFGDPAALAVALDDVRAAVQGEYGRLFHGAERERAGVDGATRALLGLKPEDPGAEAAVRRAGFRNPGRALEGLRLLREGPGRRPPSPRARRILGRVAPSLLREVAASPDPDRALHHLGRFLAASGARASYLALLEENPATAKLLVRLFGSSDFLSRYLVGHPELLDELVLGGAAVSDPGGDDLAAGLAGALERVREDDEEVLDTLRRFRNAEFLRVALGDLWGGLPPEAVGARLTRVAEACVEGALAFAWRRSAERYGEPRDAAGRPARFAVLGLGKLGGREIDYHSDLDLVFLYSGPGRTEGRDGRQLDNGEFFARLAQRLISALSTRTREGVAFSIDARLRPSGQAGPLVTPLDAFAAYHREASAVWERQALLRLRPVGGDPELGREARAVVDRELFGGPPEGDPRPEIARIRERMQRELARETRDRVDLKTGAGGIVDVEFAVQALQLLHGWRAPEARSPNTLEALGALRAERLVDEGLGQELEDGYRFLRRVEARLRVLAERSTDTLPADPGRLAELARGVGYEGKDPGPDLAAAVRACKRRVRAAYTAVMEGVGA